VHSPGSCFVMAKPIRVRKLICSACEMPMPSKSLHLEKRSVISFRAAGCLACVRFIVVYGATNRCADIAAAPAHARALVKASMTTPVVVMTLYGIDTLECLRLLLGLAYICRCRE